MSGNFLKRVPVAFVALAASVSVFAATDTDTRLQQLEQQMKQVRTETASGTYGAKTASARPEVDGAGAYFMIDAVVWKANVGGSEYAYTDNDALAAYPLSGSMKDVDFGWDWGVKVGLGYNFEHDNWEADFLFTYFSSSEGNNVSAGTASSIVPLKGAADLGGADLDFCTRATSNYRFVYDNIDVELARNYFVSKSLSLRPHFGVKSSWLTLKQSVRYTGGAFSGNTFLNKDQSKFWGIGPAAGMNSKWHLCQGFSFFGDVSGALLWGYYKVNHLENNTHAPTVDNIYISANMHRFCPTAQLALGISYDSYMNDDKQHIGISLGWETIYYWRVNQMLQIVDFASRKYSRVSEDASMQGVTLHIRWDF